MKYSWFLLVISGLALAATASAASTLYASTKDGPFKSTDGGITWIQLIVTTNDSSLPGEPSTLVMAVTRKRPQRYMRSQGSPAQAASRSLSSSLATRGHLVGGLEAYLFLYFRHQGFARDRPGENQCPLYHERFRRHGSIHGRGRHLEYAGDSQAHRFAERSHVE